MTRSLSLQSKHFIPQGQQLHGFNKLVLMLDTLAWMNVRMVEWNKFKFRRI